MDKRTLDILAELIQSQASMVRAVALISSATPEGPVRDGLSLFVVEATEHLEAATRALTDAP